MRGINMENAKFPSINPNWVKQGIMTDIERNKYLYPIMFRFLKNKTSGWNIAEFFTYIQKNDIAVYAITEMTELLVDDIRNSGSELNISYICDRRYNKYSDGYKGIEVISMDKLISEYKRGAFSQIVICSVFHVNEIFRDLMKAGVAQKDIVSITDIIFSI